MIAELRRVHRAAVAVLAVAVPTVLAGALAARTEPPTSRALPVARPEPARLPVDFARVESDGGRLRGRVTVDAARSRGVLEVRFEPAAHAPDLLLYRSASGARGPLPEDARLLGPLAPDRDTTFELPSDALSGALGFHVYSLGHGEIVASARVELSGASR
jgi:hypothetical protein